MIPYEELVASLIEWRSRQGLPTGQTDYLGPPMPMPLVGPPHPEPEQAPADEYAELADSEILSEEPAEIAVEGEIGGADAYPGEEPMTFPDTDAVSVDAGADSAQGYDAYGEAQPEPATAGSWDPEPAEAPAYSEEQPPAEGWGEPEPAVDEWGQAQAEAEAESESESYDEAQPPADDWAQAQPEPPAWDEAPVQGDAPAPESFAGDNEVTEFAPPPDEVAADEREYADVMEEPGAADLSGQTWDTEAEAEAVPPLADVSAEPYEQDPADAGPFDEAAVGEPEPMPAPEAAAEGDSTMDVDPEDLLSADEIPPPLAPPPIDVDELPPDGVAVDPAAKPDPEQQ